MGQRKIKRDINLPENPTDNPFLAPLTLPPFPSLPRLPPYLFEAHSIGNLGQMRRRGQRVLRKATVNGITRIVLHRAEILMARQAMLAGIAAGVKPGNTHSISNGSNGAAHAGPDGDNDARAFMPRNERELGGRGPVAIDGVDVGLVGGEE